MNPPPKCTRQRYSWQMDAFKGDRLFAQYSASTQVLQLHKRLILFKKARVIGQASSYEQP